jgi:formylglycine-generating enzyme
MLYRRHHLTKLIMMLPIALMVLLAGATVVFGNLAGALAPGAALNASYWGCFILVESAVFFLTVLSLPAPRFLLTRDGLIFSPPLGRDVTLAWQEVRQVTVRGRTGARQVVRLQVPRKALWRAALPRALRWLASLPLVRGATTIKVRMAGWVLRYSLVTPAAPTLAEAIAYYYGAPEARAGLGTEDALEAGAAPAWTPAVGRGASWAALILAFALAISGNPLFGATPVGATDFADNIGHFVAVLFVLGSVGCYLAGRYGSRLVGAVAPILLVTGVLLRLIFAWRYMNGGLMSMYFDVRGTWSLFWLIVPDLPLVVWTASMPTRKRAAEQLAYDRTLGIGLTLFLVLGPMFQDYLNTFYGNLWYGLLSVQDAAFLPYPALFIWALSVLSIGQTAAVKRLLVLFQGLTGLGLLVVVGLFGLGYAQAMQDLYGWEIGYHFSIDAFTLRQTIIASSMGLVIAGVAWRELARLSNGRPVRQLVSDVRTLWAAQRAKRRDGGQRVLEPGIILDLLSDNERLHGVFACLVLVFALVTFVRAPQAASACCKVSPLAMQPPATAKPGARWVRPADGMTMIFIPAATVLIGLPLDQEATQRQLCIQEYVETSRACNEALYAVSEPQHLVALDGYWIDQTDITNAQFARFVGATGYMTYAERSGWGWVWSSGIGYLRSAGASWRHPFGPNSSITGRDEYPVVQVDWHDAQAYATWVGMSLPTEEQWEYAAHGPTYQPFPWGSTLPNSSMANLCDKRCPRPGTGSPDDSFAYMSPAGYYPAGASPYGVLDMSGDVFQWTRSVWAPYPGATYHDPSYSKGYYVQRGSDGWYSPAAAETTGRYADEPTVRADDVGVRCATPGA